MKSTFVIPSGGLLSLDWGLKKVGVATVDETGTVITPQKSFRRSRAGQVWSLNADDKAELTRLKEEFEPGALILGIPVNADGSETQAAKGARNLAVKLKEFCRLEVHLVSEHLTSWEARDAKDEDSQAAALFIRDFLFSRSSS
jgi:putative Holliday junction resolvase